MSFFKAFINLSSVLIFYLIYINKNFFIRKFNLIDIPNNKKIHKVKTPLIGGVLIFLCLIYLIFINLKVHHQYFNQVIIYYS
jgi:UDP-N-acetylmuramyl pentapeptide phosphotransferase/UDP-N-acetylglucosamine-1-phosphate transferase